MRCKLKFQFDDYKGTAIVSLPTSMSLKELKVDSNLSDYMEHATDQHNLSYRSFDTDQGRMYNLILCRNKDKRLTIEGTTNFLGLELVEATMLETPDVEVSKEAEEKQLALF